MTPQKRKHLFLEFCFLDPSEQERGAGFLFPSFFSIDDVTFADLLKLSDEELGRPDLSFVIKNIGLQKYLQLPPASRKTAVNYAKHIRSMMEFGMSVEEFLALEHDGLRLQLVAIFNDLAAGPKLKRELREYPLKDVLDHFHIINSES